MLDGSTRQRLMVSRACRTEKHLDLGTTQKKMLASMLRADFGWTAPEFAQRFGITTPVARNALLRLYKRGLVNKVVVKRRTFIPGQGRLPHRYYITFEGRLLARKLGLSARRTA